MYRILDQLLPALKKDLYEDVDGKKSERLNPEKSSRIPGAVKMHREANTLDKDALFIKNHFNRSDLVNFTSPIDMNMAYSDRASINKSNGMVTESYAYLAEQMNFGTPIHTKSGYDVTMLNITVFSRVTLIETNGLYFAEAELVRIQLFVKLIAPGAKDPPFNSSHMPSSNDSAFQPTSSPTNGSLARRKRHALQTLFISEIFSKRIELFNKEVIGINISGEAKVWVWKGHNGLEIGVNVILKLGDLTEDVIHYTYLWKAQTRTGDSYDLSWEKEIVSIFCIILFSLL